MGGEWFETESEGETVQDAFNKAVEQAEYDHGHSGYTGTIAEKPDFILIPASEYVGRDPRDFVKHLIDTRDEKWIRGKWEEATAIQTGPNKWLFFGVASSLESNV
jgi:hypothetical protein